MQNSCFGYNSWTDEWILMILRHMVDNDETLKLTQGQGHKVKDQGHICSYVKLLFSYESWTDDSILMILTYPINIDETLKLTQGQGHKVKGQGHICNYVKQLLSCWSKITSRTLVFRNVTTFRPPPWGLFQVSDDVVVKGSCDKWKVTWSRVN